MPSQLLLADEVRKHGPEWLVGKRFRGRVIKWVTRGEYESQSFGFFSVHGYDGDEVYGDWLGITPEQDGRRCALHARDLVEFSLCWQQTEDFKRKTATPLQQLRAENITRMKEEEEERPTPAAKAAGASQRLVGYINKWIPKQPNSFGFIRTRSMPGGDIFAPSHLFSHAVLDVDVRPGRTVVEFTLVHGQTKGIGNTGTEWRAEAIEIVPGVAAPPLLLPSPPRRRHHEEGRRPQRRRRSPLPPPADRQDHHRRRHEEPPQSPRHRARSRSPSRNRDHHHHHHREREEEEEDRRRRRRHDRPSPFPPPRRGRSGRRR